MATSLAELTTLRVGGSPSSITLATTETALINAVRHADERNSKPLIVGGGSNVVVADDFDGEVVLVANKGIENDASACAGAWVTVQAGHPWDDFVAQAVANQWLGIEALSGIPGSTGATPIQNVGAYGQQVSSTIAQVRTWNRERNEVETLFASNCEFGYRSSIFKKHPERWVILSVTFQLKLGDQSGPISYAELASQLGVEVGQKADVTQVRSSVLSLRAAKGMVLNEQDHDTWSVGSFFLNPRMAIAPTGAPSWPEVDGRVKVSAAWLIEQAGFPRGFGLNERVTLSTKHALAITNRGAGTAHDVIELAEHIRAGVESKFKISLEFEPKIVQ